MISQRLWGLLVLAMWATPLAARADDYSEFRIPPHHVMGWSGTLSTSGNRSTSTVTGFGSSNNSSRAFQGTGSSTFSWLSDSDPARTSIGVSVLASGDGTWGSADQSIPAGVSSSSSDTRRGTESWSASLGQRYYPWAVPVGLDLNVVGIGQYQQSWSHADAQTHGNLIPPTVTVEHTSGERWLYRTVVQTDAAVGIGRVRDATGVYDAQVLESRLRESGALARPLSREGRRRMAALLYLRADYSKFRERPDKYLWDRVEDILREDGALGDSGLDARSIQRAGEPDIFSPSAAGLPRSPVLRQAGAFIGAALFDFHEHFSSGTTTVASSSRPSTTRFSLRSRTKRT
jgi:hypothetical protein